MNKKIKIVSLFGLLCLVGGTTAFNLASKKVNVASAESDVNWQDWTLTTTVDTYTIDIPANQTMLSLVVDSGSTGMFYASGATVIDGTSDKGYLNDHRPFYGDGTKNLIDYVTVNGRTVSEIIDENAATNKYNDGTASWVFGMGGQYAPITLEANHEKLYINIMSEYIKDIGETMHGIYVGFKAGAPLRDSSYVTHTLDKEISAIATSNNPEPSHFAEVTSTTDGTAVQFVRDTNMGGTSRGMKRMAFWMQKPLTNFAGYWIHDHALQVDAFLTLNGKSFEQWNGSIDDSTWDYSTCQLAGGADPLNCYNRPISVNVDAGNPAALFVCFHDNFLAMFNEGDVITLGVKKGFSFDSEGTMFYQDKNTATSFIFKPSQTDFLVPAYINYSCLGGDTSYNDIAVTSISDKTSVNFREDGYYGVDIKLNKELNTLTTYDVYDGNNSLRGNRAIASFITVNGVSVADINASVDDSAYDYSTAFPQNAAEFYQVPILPVKTAADTISLMIHGDYVKTLGDSITVGVKKGLTIYNSQVISDESRQYNIDGIYQVTANASQTVTVTNDKYFVDLFVADNMHLTDYTEELNYCADAEHGYYAIAKAAYNALTASQKALFRTAPYSAAYARLSAWAAANGDSFDAELNLVSANALNRVISSSNSALIIASLLGVFTIGAACFLLTRKKKEQK